MATVGLSTRERVRLESRAHQMVAALLIEEDLGERLDTLTPLGDDEFEADLIDRELAMMADGIPLQQSYFRLAVIRAARDTLLLRADIRRLPSQAARNA